MSLRLLVLIGCALVGSVTFAEAQQAIFVVRHAERLDDSRDSLLSEAGLRRAEVLARLLKDTGVNTIYVSDLQWTIKTAEPLAKALKLQMKNVAQYEGPDMEKLVATLRAQHARDTVLVVGHSNTMPALLRALGDPNELKLSRDEYDLLMVIVPKREGRPTVLRLRF